jgi:type I restriction enzyme R subunit
LLLERALEEFNAAQRELKEKGFDINAFSIYWILRRHGVATAENTALEVDNLFGRLPNYRENPNERRELKAEIYKVLLPKVVGSYGPKSRRRF